MNDVPIFRSREYLDLVAKLPCVRCWKHEGDGSVVAAHYFGPRRHTLGGGMGHKVTDSAVAAFCAQCHAHMDGYLDGNNWERSEEFLYSIVVTYTLVLARLSMHLRDALLVWSKTEGLE
jgi:hypothetical protein